MLEIAATSLMLVVLAVAVITDLRVGKIYNWLTMPCAAVGVALGGIAGGLAGAADRLVGAAVVLGVVLVLSVLMRVGGGDAKLLMAVGALKGFHFAIGAMLLTGVFGGVLAVVMMVRRRAVKDTARNMIVNILSNAGGVRTELAAGSPAGKIPYSIAIALGSVATLLLGA